MRRPDENCRAFLRRQQESRGSMEIQKILTRYDSYLNKGKLKDAEVLLLLSLQDAEAEGLYGARLTLLNELEGLYRTTGRARQAIEISEKALALISVLGLTGQEPHAVTLLNGATACRAAGENEKALQMYRRAEQILCDLGQEEGYSMTALYNNISQAYLDLQQPQQALHYQQQALTQIRKFTDTKAEEATTQISMVQSLLMLGRSEEAGHILEEAMAYYDTAEGQEDPHRSAAYAAAGEYAFRMGNYAAAEQDLQEALRLSLEYYGENDACEVIRKNLKAVQQRKNPQD